MLEKESIYEKLKGEKAKIIYGFIAAAGIFLVAFLILSYTGDVGYESGAINSGAVTAGEGDTVYVDYTGKLENGTVFESRKTQFIIGSGQMVKGFDTGVAGMKKGEEKTITVSPENGYGVVDPQKFINVEKIMVLPRFINVSAGAYKNGTGRYPVEGDSLNIPNLPWPVKIATIVNDMVFIDISPGTDTLPELIGERTVTLTGNEVILTLKIDPEHVPGSIVVTQMGPAKISNINETTITLDFNHLLAGETLIFNVKIEDIIKKN